MPKRGTSILSGEWTNQRVTNVLDLIDPLLDHLIFEGLLSSDYLPLETPVGPEVIRRMTPEQFQDFLDTLPTLEEKAAVIKVLGELDIPKSAARVK